LSHKASALLVLASVGSLQIDDYSRFININARSAMAFLDRGQAYLKLNDHNNALSDLRFVMRA
jgi:regulator of sirC expression with transglutaminase-like and TPR domain